MSTNPLQPRDLVNNKNAKNASNSMNSLDLKNRSIASAPTRSRRRCVENWRIGAGFAAQTRSEAARAIGSRLRDSARRGSTSAIVAPPKQRAVEHRLRRVLAGDQRAEDERGGGRTDIARRRRTAMAEALGERQRSVHDHPPGGAPGGAVGPGILGLLLIVRM